MAGYSTPSWTDGASPAISAANLTAIGEAIELSQHPYGVCATTSAIAAKEVTVDFSGTLSLYTGLTVWVKFTYSNTASSPTLNVNSTGAKSIMAIGTTPMSGWSAGQILSFTYDGTNWLCNGASGNLRVSTGSYTGTGTYGVGNQNSLTFDFTPIALIVYDTTSGFYGLCPIGTNYGWYSSMFWSVGQTASVVNQYGCNISSGGNTVSWYTIGNSAVYQLNVSGHTYNYIAIGAF